MLDEVRMIDDRILGETTKGSTRSGSGSRRRFHGRVLGSPQTAAD